MEKSIRSRRQFLKAVAAAPLAVGWPDWMPRMAFSPAGEAPRGDTLVVVFLRGAADGLNIIVPHGDEAYYQARPNLNIARPDHNSEAEKLRALDLDGFFGLHPSLRPLLDSWQERQLAVIQACGAPDDSRSHFRAMELMERGVSDEKGPASGWIGRHLSTLNTGNASPLRAVGLGEKVPLSLRGTVPVTALRSIADFHLGGDLEAAASMQRMLANLYQSDDELSLIGQETLDIIDTLQQLNPAGYQASGERDYPESTFGQALQQVAMLVKAEVGLEVAALDVGGWDTHFSQGGSEGLMAGLLADLASGLAALHADLVDYMSDLTVVVMSEFGRRVQENASLGTDHGHGSFMMLLGGGLNGGRVYGRWPGLAEHQLFGPGDLAVTTDYRDVLGEICRTRLNNQATQAIFPGYNISPLGLSQARSNL